jgi:hypothetical protein
MSLDQTKSCNQVKWTRRSAHPYSMRKTEIRNQADAGTPPALYGGTKIEVKSTVVDSVNIEMRAVQMYATPFTCQAQIVTRASSSGSPAVGIGKFVSGTPTAFHAGCSLPRWRMSGRMLAGVDRSGLVIGFEPGAVGAVISSRLFRRM